MRGSGMSEIEQTDTGTAFARRTGIAAADIEFLRNLPLFRSLSPDFIRYLLSRSTMRGFSRGSALFHRGEPSDRLFVVMAGRVKLYRETADGQESVVAICNAGESFAEAAIMQLETYPVNAAAIEESRLLVIPSSDFLMKVRENAQLNENVMSVMSSRLRQLVRVVEQRTAKSSTERLATFLIQLVPENQCDATLQLPMDKATIAANLGMKPETFSRSLAKLRKFGVKVDGNEVCIPNVPALRRLSDGAST